MDPAPADRQIVACRFGDRDNPDRRENRERRL